MEGPVLPSGDVVSSEVDFETFVADTFDAEEAVMIVLALRDGAAPLTVAEILGALEQNFKFRPVEDRRVVEKRIEIRMRDLVERAIIRSAGDRKFAYAADGETDGMVARVADLFASRPRELNQMIYSTHSRARRLAEAFRL